MSPTVKISIEEVRHMLTELGNQIEREHGDETELQSDYFWWIQPDEAVDPLKDPENLTLGDVSFTIENLRGWDWTLGTSMPIDWMAQLMLAIGRTPAQS